MDALARWQLLRLHVEDGIPLAALARDTETSLQTLQRWKQAYTAGGIARLKPRERVDAGTRRTAREVEPVRRQASQRKLSGLSRA